ncbi:hypothetical protein GCM10011452_09320 [Gemmobacter lanyuensis]|uniref:Uncharacterized protein n=2 Tax=Gemmobacter lanyuensis TaxID=1054497 RepID=A0A918MH85_9RHOB|nr:hypothetical protein GCM10011452_09320 [Gemmobacter lanyuensis]
MQFDGAKMKQDVVQAMGFDRQSGRVVGHRAVRVAQPMRRVVREMPIQRALEWAFGVEHARIDFDLTGARQFDRVGVSPEYVLMQRARLGCNVDGGGVSGVHPDAELIAAAVEALPEGCGGRRMAVLVAECARAGGAPDWRGDERRRVVPKGWDLQDDGSWSAHVEQGDEYRFVAARSRVRTGRATYCPVSITGGVWSVAAARRAYLGWYGALLHLAHVVGQPGYLSSVAITGQLPPLSPWKKEFDVPQQI